MDNVYENNHFNYDLDHNELRDLDEFLEKKGKLIWKAINTQLKVYSEQIILLCLYARQAINEHKVHSLFHRLHLMSFIEDVQLDNEQQEKKVKEKLMEMLNSGFDCFSVINVIRKEQPDLASSIEIFLTKEQAIFKKQTTSSLLYSCSQLSAAIFKKVKIIKGMVEWLEEYSNQDVVRQKMVDLIREKKMEHRKSLPDDKFEIDFSYIASLVLTNCKDKIKTTYQLINQYVPTYDYEVQKVEIEKTPKIQGNIMNSSVGYKHGTKIQITFDSRLLDEGYKETLMEQIENTLFGLKDDDEPFDHEKKLVLLSEVNTLSNWHKKSQAALIKRVDQVPRYIASIIESDLKRIPVKENNDKNHWYSYVTSKISQSFDNDGIMSTWCHYDEKATHERFKKRVNYLKFGLKAYQPISSVIAGAVYDSNNSYPLQSTTFPSLWTPKNFK